MLVVHPFANQIFEQYKKHRSQLFKNPMILPDFELETIPAVQSLGGENHGFNNWFEALQYMKEISMITIFVLSVVGRME